MQTKSEKIKKIVEWQKKNRDYVNAYQKEWRKGNKERLRVLRRKNYLKNKKYIVSYQKEWRKNNMDRVLKSNKRWVDKYRKEPKNKIKISARRKLLRAVQSGVVKRGVCRDCSSKRVQAHHTDYSKPLIVIWLCDKHHKLEHVKIKKYVSIKTLSKVR